LCGKVEGSIPSWIQDFMKPKKEKNKAAVELGKLGGIARFKSLSQKRRIEIATKANEAKAAKAKREKE
jgi:hypothetical protein